MSMIEEYQRAGFTCIEGLFNKEEVLDLQLATDELIEQSRSHKTSDEKFDLEAFNSGKLKMPFYDLCVRPKMEQMPDKVVLGSCDNEAASWIFENAHLKPKSKPNLCLTAGPGPSRLTPGGRRLPSRHVAREVFLQVCDNQLEDRQSWTTEAVE